MNWISHSAHSALLLIPLSDVSVHSQDGDIIAPELTPLKASWSNNNEGEDGEDGGSRDVNRPSVNGQKKAKTQLFK